jgi:hypothetical protein
MAHLNNNLSSLHSPHQTNVPHTFITIPLYFLAFAVIVSILWFGILLPSFRRLLSEHIDAIYNRGLREGEERGREKLLKKQAEEKIDGESGQDAEKEQVTLISLHKKIDKLCDEITELKEEMSALRKRDVEDSDDDTVNDRSGYTVFSCPIVAPPHGDEGIFEEESTFGVPEALVDDETDGWGSAVDSLDFGRYRVMAEFMRGDSPLELEDENQRREAVAFARNEVQNFLDTPD